MSNAYLGWFTSDMQFPFYIQYGGHDEDTELHRHADFSELAIVLRGHATHIVNDESFFIKKGNAFVINGSTPHAYKEPQDFRICNIMYRPEMLASIGPDLRKSNGFQTLFVLEPFYRNIHSYASKLALPITSLDYVESLISKMIEEYHNREQGYQTMLLSRFTELVVYLSRHYDTQEKGGEGNHLMHLANAISYIEDHFLEPLSLEQVASRSNISVRHLNRMFQSYYGTTPISYMHRLRLEKACNLLKHSSIPITQISYECGYNDSNYFTRQFTKAYGISPRAFRQNDEVKYGVSMRTR
ncbi:MAG: helix-turn-helix domain-containing protein [Paenibacillus sp.]|uniref:helix-turn-helix domain-containing protein n=1 Tax=Paenibacillus sp. TaxID=58172 RepID=UPI0025D663A8|nr:helix-turn-helix domain-containing protein [Paenibacillus sp.]MBR2567228.1 helix-turn-helix domain-containing protein [Paenibacillus sp.]